MQSSLLPKLLYSCLLLLSLAGCSDDPPALSESTSSPRSRITNVLGVVVKATAINQKLQATGTFLPNESVLLTSEIAGKITSLNFCEGCPVGKGQVLAEIDKQELEARMQKVEVDLKLAQEDYDRSSKLLEINAVPAEEVSQAGSRLASFQAELDILKVQLKKMSIKAPFSGMTGLREISVGTYISPGMPITSIRQINPIKVEFAVPERYAEHINKNGTIWIILPNRQDTFEAKIYAIDPGIDPATRALKVRARMDNRNNDFIPGGYCSVYYQVYQNTTTFNIPSEAVLPELSGQKVMVKSGGKAVSRQVKLGIRNENKVQILEGLSEGDTVLTTGLLILTDGMPIEVDVPQDTTFSKPRS